MFGLFDWIWDVFYAISKSMYAIIDNLLGCANILCGIVPITYAGQEMDFIAFLLRNHNIAYAFVGSVLVATVLVVLFAVIQIIRSASSEKVQKTPAQIAVSAAKTILTFLFIPAAMMITIFLTNTLMRILYSTTLGGAQSMGSFLAGAFGQNALKGGVQPDFYLLEEFNYTITGSGSSDNRGISYYVNLSDYDFFFSYIASLVILVSLGLALMMFIDRAISIVILFIFAPLSLSSSILDDGARFKLWRDQFLTKFLSGYGCILAINIYALIVAAITSDNLVFFENGFLNYFMKIVIVVGGGISMQRIMALVGNLINAGAGSNELRDAAIAGGSFRRAMFAPLGATRSAINFARDSANNGLGTTIGRALGFKTSRDYDIERGRVSRGQGSSKSGGSEGSGSANHKTGSSQQGNPAQNAAKNAIGGIGGANNGANNGGNNHNAGGGGGNANNNNNNPGSNMVSNAISNSLNNNHDLDDLK